VVAPEAHGLEPVLRIHDAAFVRFLETCWAQWVARGFKGEAMPTVWPSRAMPRRVPPRDIDGLVGYYCLAGETTISAGTWEAARASADVALTAQKIVAGGERAAFALCRPPGHHASTDMYGGYCFLNNAAIAAQAFRDQGAGRVAILDVDFHHGNGTQEIFYRRDDVLFLSLHGDPLDAFPYFLGGADETGEGPGEGFNVNYPLPPATPYESWSAALEEACGRIAKYGPDALVVSLGVDTFEKDPISFFKLKSEDFTRYGERIARLGLPTLFVMEGGYAVAEVGINTVNVLEGFENG
jgi:acetoin utilization deacetylase AcuC-like enzyme